MNKSDKKIFATLFLSIFSAVTGIGIVVPLLPVYANGLGASGLYIGMIFGAFSLSRTFLLPYFGKASDKNGRKPYIVIGLLGYALVSFAFIFAGDVNGLIVIRFVQGMASAMIMPVTQAYVGDITPPGKEGFYMGLFSLSMFISLSIGPLIGGVVNDHFSLDASFAMMGGLACVGFLFSLFFLPPVKKESVVTSMSSPISWRMLLKDPVIAGLFIVRLVYVTCIGTIWCFLPVFADQEFGLSSSQIGTLVMLPVFLSGLLQVPMGFVADRLNKKYMIVFGGLLAGCAIFSFEWVTGFWDMFIINVIFGIGGGILTPPLMAWTVIKGTHTKSMGAVMGLLTMGHSLGMLLGSIIAGVTMDFLELRNVFPVGSLVMFLGVVLFLVCTTARKAYPVK